MQDNPLISNSGKTIQVIAFLSAIMAKTGLPSDMARRKRYVSRLQDSEEWKKERKLPKANEKWPTCLIIAPSTVVHNWEREFETVRQFLFCILGLTSRAVGILRSRIIFRGNQGARSCLE